MLDKKNIIYPDGDSNTSQQIGDTLYRSLEEIGNFVLYNDKPKNSDEYIERIKSAHCIVLGWDLPLDVMVNAPNLELISFTGIGVQKFVDMSAAREQGITVCNCPGYGDNAVAEHALALLLACAKKINYFDRNVKSGCWQDEERCMELSGKTIGLIGFGGIAQTYSKMVVALGMKVVVWTRSKEKYQDLFPHVEFLDFATVLDRSDVLSIHIAHTPQTEKLIGRDVLRRLKRGTVIINTARGEIIDEDELVLSLRDGHIAAAGLDVFRTEPLESQNPLTYFDNVVLTPHVAFSTPDASQRLTQMALQNVISFYSGKPINVVES